MPRKIRELLKDYRKAGATINVSRGKGSHRRITHPDVHMVETVSGKDGADAKPYQEHALKKFIQASKETK